LHVDSIILAAEHIFAEVLGVKLKHGRPFVKTSPFAADSVVVVIGFNGDVEGQVIYSFRNDYAKNVASIMCGMNLKELDELSMSALGELCNMISGRLVTHFDKLAGQKVGITPPTVLTGKSMQIAVKTPVLCIPYEENGEVAFEINYSLR